MEERYYKFSTYLKKHFGVKVHKVSVDAGFSCPNRDGKISDEGCMYCDNQAFSFQARSGNSLSLRKQIEEGIKAARERFKAEKFIIYFQAYTNTYAPVDKLKEAYDVIKEFKDVVSLAIATRPDCVNKETLDMISTYTDDYEVWIEYGLQSMHNKTLESINRGHGYEDFLKAFGLTRKYNMKICAHVIIGLPGETKGMMLDTAGEMARLKIDGVKIHPLHIVKNTRLEQLFKKSEYTPLKLEQYLDILVDFLAYLWPDTVIQRTGAYCSPQLLVAPDWVATRNIVEQELERILQEKNTAQGKLYSQSHP